MSSLTLSGATGANLGWARDAEPDEDYDITYVPKRRFLLGDAVPVDEDTLRQWFERLLTCHPSKEQVANGYPWPTRETQRELIRLPPDIGFQLTGDVDRDAGFAVCWRGGWIRGNASGCLLAVNFDINDNRAHAIRSEIETLLPNANGTCKNMG